MITILIIDMTSVQEVQKEIKRKEKEIKRKEKEIKRKDKVKQG
jgi:hypothetical protein